MFETRFLFLQSQIASYSITLIDFWHEVFQKQLWCGAKTEVLMFSSWNHARRLIVSGRKLTQLVQKLNRSMDLLDVDRYFICLGR